MKRFILALGFVLLLSGYGYADIAKQVDFLISGYRHPTTDAVLSGGQVYTYLDGTSTLSAMWTDKDKGGSATNPVILDSSGKAEIYGDNTYKFEIYDSEGSLIETLTGLEYQSTSTSLGVTVNVSDIISLIAISDHEDSVTAITSEYITGGESGGGVYTYDASVNKTTANGGTIIDPDTIGGFDGTVSTISAFLSAQGTGSGTGCWVRIFDGPILTTWFGAVSGDSVSDSISIQAAIVAAENLVSAFNGGGAVYNPPGDYDLSSTLLLTSGFVKFFGDGAGTQFTRNSDYGNTFTVASSDVDNSKIKMVVLSDFYVLSQFADTAGSQIEANRASQLFLQNLILQDGFNQIELNGCDNVYITNVDASSGQRYSSFVAGSSIISINPYDAVDTTRTQSASIYITGSQFKQDTVNAYIQDGLYISSCDGIYITGSHIGFTQNCIRTQPLDAVANIQNIFISSSYIDGNVEQSTYLWRADEAKVTPHTGVYYNISFTGVGFLRPAGSGVLFTSSTVRDVSFSSCSFLGGDEDGVVFGATSAPIGVSIIGCSFRDWNRDNVGTSWDVRFISGNTANNIVFSANNFESTNMSQNIAFGGSEDNISISTSTFSQSSLGGTLTGKTIKIDETIGLTGSLQKNFGEVQISPDANGNGTITHGLYDVPSSANVSLKGDTPNGASVQSTSASVITIRVFDASGADVTSGTFTVIWDAKV